MTKFKKLFKSKIWLDIWNKHPQNTSKYRISAKSVKGFGSYEHLKFRPICGLKCRLWRHNYVIVVTWQIFCYPSVEYIKLDTCVKFPDHRSNNNQVMMGILMPQPPWLTVQKWPMSNRVKESRTLKNTNWNYFLTVSWMVITELANHSSVFSITTSLFCKKIVLITFYLKITKFGY